MVGNQIGNLTPDFSFSHNLCFKYLNGSCKLILDIYVLRSFQWYTKLFNLMSLDTWNRPLKIWKSIGTPTRKVGTHLGMWGLIFSHFPTLSGALNVTPGLYSWLAPLQALLLVASLRLRLQQISFRTNLSW
jgi:hypothetical protein